MDAFMWKRVINADDVPMCEPGISIELVYFGTFLMVQLVFC